MFSEGISHFLCYCIRGLIMKRYLNLSIFYAVLAMLFGVFYREFIKWFGFIGDTSLSVMHTHYFVLGTIFFLVLLVLEKNFSFTNSCTRKAMIVYPVGLNLTSIIFLARGVLQVLGTELSSAVNASISGFAGIGHILLGIGMLLILLRVKKVID